MESSLWKIIIIIILLSFISAAFVLVWFFKKVRPIKRVVIKETGEDSPEADVGLKRWRRLAVFWPLMCIIFAGIIIYQSVQGMKERVQDAAFSLIPLIFFGIGMAMRRRLLKERRHATVLTTATVISTGRRTAPGESHFFPEYEFYADGRKYNVRSPSGYNVCFVSEGKQVDLYYAPQNPELFYVPLMQKHDNRFSVILCGAGIAFPVMGLFAPLIRDIFSFLY